jgi:hypothetical protein
VGFPPDYFNTNSCLLQVKIWLCRGLPHPCLHGGRNHLPLAQL